MKKNSEALETRPHGVRGPDGEPKGGRRKIRVLLAEDHPAVREVLAGFLKEQPDLELVAEAGDGRRAVDLTSKLRPDVVLMDISMPRLNGIEATRLICDSLPTVAVIGLSMHEDAAVGVLLREAGALDFVPKDGGAEILLAAIHGAVRRIPRQD